MNPGELPKYRLSVADLQDHDFEGATSLSAAFASNKRMHDLNIYLHKLDVRAIPVNFGYDLAGKGGIRRDDDTFIRDHFGVMYETHLQLAQEEHGYYQIAVATSGQTELEIQDVNGSYVKRISALSGIDDTRFLCANQNLYIRRGEQLGLRLRQTHRTGATMTALIYWRKVSSASAPSSASCGATGELFRSGQATMQMQNILNEGWKVPAAENLTLIRDGENLVTNGNFENVGGLKLPAPASWYEYFDAVPGWTAYNKIELQKNHNGVTPLRGGSYWIDLDVIGGTDAIYQEFAVKPNTTYRQLFDLTAPAGTNPDTAKVEIYRVGLKPDGNYQFDSLETVAPLTNGVWRTDQRQIHSSNFLRMRVKLMEAGNNDNYGAYIDNVVFREIRENASICDSGAVAQDGIKILSARYGSSKFVDVSEFARSRCEEKSSCALTANNNMNGDPETGVGKVLTIRYSCLNGDKEISVNEHANIQLSCP